MEIDKDFRAASEYPPVRGKKFPSDGAGFAANLGAQVNLTLAQTERGGDNNSRSHFNRLENSPKSLCKELENIGLYVYEGWITKEQEDAMRMEFGKLLRHDSLTSKDIGKKLEEMHIHVQYLYGKALKENALSDMVVNDTDWLLVDRKLFEEVLKSSKSSFQA